MLRRFALYGFLKNQRYFEPFIVLFFLQRGLSFTEIGLLVAVRELCINLMEVPSGAAADLFGRRRAMMLSFGAYIASFAVFGFGRLYWQFVIAMALFALGEAFRSGTHKAMIFTWLREQDRLDEKTRTYGYTRSWSKMGSAVSTVIAVTVVFVFQDYSWVFWLAIVPYVAGLVNFLGYPSSLEGQPATRICASAVGRHLWTCVKNTLVLPRLRRLVLESMTFEGVFKAFEDYLQPVVRNAALALPVFIALAAERRTALLIGLVYVVLYLVSAVASRHAHAWTGRAGGEEGGTRAIWAFAAVAYVSLVPLLFYERYYIAIAVFVLLALAQNVWRPIQVSRFDEFAGEQEGATILSIESQSKSLATMIVAPMFGASVDLVRLHCTGGEFWPVAAIAGVIAVVMLLVRNRPSVWTGL